MSGPACRRPRVAIEGSGIAALTTARLLQVRGFDISFSEQKGRDGEIQPRESRPVAVPLETARLLAELWDAEALALLSGTVLDGRIVNWDGMGPVWVPGASIVIDTAELADSLARRLAGSLQTSGPDDADWRIRATGRQGTSVCHGSGARVGRFLKSQNARWPLPQVAVTEARATGWFYLMPTQDDIVALVVAPNEQRLPEHVTDIVEVLSARSVMSMATSVEFGPVLRTAGRLGPIDDTTSLLVGDAAFAPDPVGGDGVGQALRSAILAQAVLGSLADGACPSECLAQHYRRRIREAYRRHLESCASHYSSIFNAALWAPEVEAIHVALSRLPARDPTPWRFRLDHLELVRLD